MDLLQKIVWPGVTASESRCDFGCAKEGTKVYNVPRKCCQRIFTAGMIHIPANETGTWNGYNKKSPFSFCADIFKRKKPHDDQTNVEFEDPSFIGDMDRSSEHHTSVPTYGYGAVPRVPSTLSVTAVDIMVQAPCCPPSPAISNLTLTPGRTRDIDQDMEALRLSRQDNPFLQVLASRESLVDSLEESESDDANLMCQEFPADLDVDPLTLPEIHKHMIRSPPPTTWPKSPNFKESLHRCNKKSPSRIVSPRHSCVNLDEESAEALGSASSQPATCSRLISPRPHHRPTSDCRDRSSNPFSLLNPDVRRLHTDVADDNVLLVSSKSDEHQEQRRFELKTPPPRLPLLSSKRA
ncbi:uncharacterized protein LOC110826909 isoform X2 [Zootermopsis nevadensis]|uniref:uncharacterized protein LOC110826909 isoform X2 n=1 Tax=Zootermopsis nevadensis TaxID=136037 RepID=UPI000B8EE6DA|nr:uncharacterized protein LOC110826909 isoform X2 [Zootermopsis nevadensis]